MGTVFDKAVGKLRQHPVADAAYRQQAKVVEVAKMVRTWRTAAGLTQGELADRMKTSQSVIARIESFQNTRMPNLDTLIRIAHECGLDLVLGGAAHDQLPDYAVFEAVERHDFVAL